MFPAIDFRVCALCLYERRSPSARAPLHVRLDGLLLQRADEDFDLLLTEAALTPGSSVAVQISHI